MPSDHEIQKLQKYYQKHCHHHDDKHLVEQTFRNINAEGHHHMLLNVLNQVVIPEVPNVAGMVPMMQEMPQMAYPPMVYPPTMPVNPTQEPLLYPTEP